MGELTIHNYSLFSLEIKEKVSGDGRRKPLTCESNEYKRIDGEQDVGKVYNITGLKGITLCRCRLCVHCRHFHNKPS